MSPRVSVLLPNLNNRPYLEERMETILNQTFGDWELIVVDSHSDDGAWEFFQQCAKEDPRIKLFQDSRQGIYNSWNTCIRLARGEYVYFATSDDTMEPTFLETMVKALDEHPECDLAHCKLKIIDERGQPHPSRVSWDLFYGTLYFGDLIDKKHIRLAPHDGILYCCVRTVYTSITQLLIHRSLFDKIGLFLTNYGPVADFEWGMRASLVANIIHVPEYLATWRVRGGQATDLDFLDSVELLTQFLKMINQALLTARSIRPDLVEGIKKRELQYFYSREIFLSTLRSHKSIAKRCGVALRWLFVDPKIVWECCRARLGSEKAFAELMSPVDFSRKLIGKYNLQNHVRCVDE